MSKSAPYSGVTTATLTVTNSTTGLNGYKYRCVIKGSGTCATSTNSNAGTLTVNSTPTITGTTPASRCDAGTVTLGATASTGTINWYAASTGGSSLGTGTSFITPSISATTPYYVDATNGGCTTASRTSVTATVTTTPSTPTVSSNSTLCGGSTINLTSSTVSNATYSWTGPNSFTSTSPTPTIANATTAMSGTYSVTVTLNNCTSSVGTTSVSVTSSTTPSVTISVDNNPTCTGQVATFTATPTNGGTTPTYVWSVNGGTVGTNNTYSSSGFANGDVVSCIITSSSACASPATANSNTITIAVTGQLTPSITISAGSTSICAGTAVTFTATATNGGASPSYQWSLNGGVTGTNSNTYTAPSVTNGDVVTCVLTSNSSCVSTPTVTSNSITMSVTPTVTPGVSIAITSGSTTICSGAIITFTATATNGGTNPAYQWTLNNNNVGTGNTYSSSSIANGDVVACILTSNASCASTATVTSNSISMIVTAPVTPSVSINISSGSNTTCAGSQVTFTAAPTNGGTTPTYAWSVNGGTVGTNSNTYSSSSFANGDAVSCILTSNANCITTATATSNTVTMSITTNTVTPSVTIAGSTNSICAGTVVTFTATPTNAGSAQSYQWMVGGNSVGTNSTTYTDASLTNGQVVTCNMTSTLSCGSSTITSNSITMNVTPTITPSVTFSITSGNNPSCAGQSVTFTASPTNGGTSPAYVWSINGGTVATTNPFMSSSFANGDVVTCVLTSNASCITSPTATSSGTTMTITTIVAPSILLSGTNTICAGSTATFTATPTNGGVSPTYQWMVNGGNVGTNSATYSSSSLTNGQQISCIMTSDLSCISPTTTLSNTITMNVTAIVTPSVTIAVTAGSNPTSAGQSITFTASPTNGGTSPTYQWKVNSSNVGTNSTSYTSSSFTSGDAVTCVLTSNAACISTTTVTSTNTITIGVGAVVTNTTTVHVINTATAKVKSNVTSDGGSPVTAKGTVWSTSPNPTTVSYN